VDSLAFGECPPLELIVMRFGLMSATMAAVVVDEHEIHGYEKSSEIYRDSENIK
jgi:hypothetical protein